MKDVSIKAPRVSLALSASAQTALLMLLSPWYQHIPSQEDDRAARGPTGAFWGGGGVMSPSWLSLGHRRFAEPVQEMLIATPHCNPRSGTFLHTEASGGTLEQRFSMVGSEYILGCGQRSLTVDFAALSSGVGLEIRAECSQTLPSLQGAASL